MDNLINGEKPEFGNPRHIAIIQKDAEDAKMVEEMKDKDPREAYVEEIEMYRVSCPECNSESDIDESVHDCFRQITDTYKHPETGKAIYLCSNCKHPLYEG